MILNNRINRDFKENLLRNLSMIAIIALSMALVVSLCSAGDSIYRTIHDEWKLSNVEDGSFETYTPLSGRNLKDLAELNVTTEKMFYTDVNTNTGATLRLFSNRMRLNLPHVEAGTLPQADDDIFLEKKYVKDHNLSIGNSVVINQNVFYICGIGCLPEYSYVKQNNSDVAPNDEFSVAVVTQSAWKRIRGNNKTIYNYAYKLGEHCSARDVKDKLIHLKNDESAIKDTYLKAQLQAAADVRKNFGDATSRLKVGTADLAKGIERFGKNLTEAGIEANTGALSDAALELYAGLVKLDSTFGRYLAESTEIETVNLSSFNEAQYNPRIHGAIDDSRIGKQVALVVGVFLVILLVYMLAVFASGTVEKERSVIGTLYALGYSKKEILSHYMKTPTRIAAIGAAIGTAVGFMLTDYMANSSASLYSFPKLQHVFPPYLIAYGLGLPTLASFLINRCMLSKKLKATPLAMLHNAAQHKGRFSIPLSDQMEFGKKYKIRQFFREFSGNLTLFFGMTIAALLIMFSVACYGSINVYIHDIANDIRFSYMYILRNPVTDLPKNPCLGYTRGFYADFPMTGSEMEVTLLGIDSDNPYFTFASQLGDDASKIYMSDSVRIKFGYHIGERIVLRDNADDTLYAFEVAGEVPYGNGLYFFMNLDTMRKAFGLPYFDENDLKLGERRPASDTYYYNTVFSNEKLNFKHNMMLSEIAKDDLAHGADKCMTLMWDMIIMMVVVSVIIFVAVMYLLMKLEIDRSSFSISLLKALGYAEKTVNSFYLGASFYLMLVTIIIGLPICRLIVGAAYPFCVSNVNGGFSVSISPLQYGIIIAIIVITYFATRYMLVRYLRKIKLTEILKNRE